MGDREAFCAMVCVGYSYLTSFFSRAHSAHLSYRWDRHVSPVGRSSLYLFALVDRMQPYVCEHWVHLAPASCSFNMFLPFLDLLMGGRVDALCNELSVILTTSVSCNVQCCRVLKRQGAISYVECDIMLYLHKKSNIPIWTAWGLVDILPVTSSAAHPQNSTFPLQSSNKVYTTLQLQRSYLWKSDDIPQKMWTDQTGSSQLWKANLSPLHFIVKVKTVDRIVVKLASWCLMHSFCSLVWRKSTPHMFRHTITLSSLSLLTTVAVDQWFWTSLQSKWMVIMLWLAGDY